MALAGLSRWCSGKEPPCSRTRSCAPSPPSPPARWSLTVLRTAAAPAPAATPPRPTTAWPRGSKASSPTGSSHNDQFDFDDYGLTADFGFALAPIGGQGAAVARDRATRWPTDVDS